MGGNQPETAAEWLDLITQAMNTGRADIMDSLVALGLSINFKDDRGGTLMHMAASIGGGNIATMKWLKEHNVGINGQNNEGDMPIHIAAGCGYIEAVKWLLDNGVDVNAGKDDGPKHETPIHKAAMLGKVEVMRCLKERGADLYARDNYGLSPIDSAIMRNQTESIRCLKALGADVDARDNDGKTPMFKAAMGGKIEGMKCLAHLGADVNARDNEDTTPMYWAAITGNIETIQCLKELGADVNAKDKDGATPMFAAAFKGQLECLKYLAKLGADVNEKSKNGTTLVDAANVNGHSEVVEWLRAKASESKFTETKEMKNLQQRNNELTNKVLAKQERERILKPIREYKDIIAHEKNEEEKKYEEDMKIWQEKMKKWEEKIRQAEKKASEWSSQKLCPHCGGKIGFFGKTCKVCRKKVWEHLDEPARPMVPRKPEYKKPKFNAQNYQRIEINFGKHNWRVLDIQNDKALLWSKLGAAISYEQIDEYLKDFLNKFSTVEKDMIIGGYIFLLDGNNVIKYFGEEGHIRKDVVWGNNSLYFGSKENEKDNPASGSDWWLRSSSELIRQKPGIFIKGPYAPFVGTPSNAGPCITETHLLENEKEVRPALWLKI